MDEKIAFISAHKHPSVDSTLKTLREMFPEHQVKTFQIVDILRRKKIFMLINLIVMIKEYGREIISGGKKASACFFRTTYIFKAVKKIIPEMLKKDNFYFSFQIGSVFDTSAEGIPHFIYTDHSHMENLRYPGFTTKDLYRREWIELEKSIYKNAALCFTRSSNIQRSIIHDYNCDPSKVVCVYAGSNAMPAKGMPKNNRDYTNKNILFVGNFWERKGGPELIEAFKKVLEVEPEASLTIVGSSPDVDVPNCRVVGRVGLDKLEEYFSRASVFCLPTKWEPFGIAILEAMQHKLPVVATRIGAIPDFVKPGINGYLVESGEIKGLAAALIVLIEDSVRSKKFGEAGFEIVNKNYTWEKTGVKIKREIEAVLGKSHYVSTEKSAREDKPEFHEVK